MVADSTHFHVYFARVITEVGKLENYSVIDYCLEADVANSPMLDLKQASVEIIIGFGWLGRQEFLRGWCIAEDVGPSTCSTQHFDSTASRTHDATASTFGPSIFVASLVIGPAVTKALDITDSYGVCVRVFPFLAALWIWASSGSRHLSFPVSSSLRRVDQMGSTQRASWSVTYLFPSRQALVFSGQVEKLLAF